MLKDAKFKRVILRTGRTDLRRGIDGLFLFCGIRKDRIKGILFEGDGFCMVYKRLTDGRFQWPSTPDEARDISPEQFRMLMEGYTVDSSIRSFRSVISETGENAPK